MSGFTQGSHLGPLLFFIYFNDVCECFLNTIYSLYTDDLNIHKKNCLFMWCCCLPGGLRSLVRFLFREIFYVEYKIYQHISFTENLNVLSQNTCYTRYLDENSKYTRSAVKRPKSASETWRITHDLWTRHYCSLQILLETKPTISFTHILHLADSQHVRQLLPDVCLATCTFLRNQVEVPAGVAASWLEKWWVQSSKDEFTIFVHGILQGVRWGCWCRCRWNFKVLRRQFKIFLLLACFSSKIWTCSDVYWADFEQNMVELRLN